MDERAHHITARAAAATLAIAYGYQLIAAVAKFVAARGVFAATSEIIFLAVIPWVFLYFARSDESLLLPKVGDRDVEELLTSGARRERTVRYAKEAAVLAAVMTALDIAANAFTGYRESLPWPEPAVWALEFVLAFAVFFGISYLWGEFQTKRYVRSLTELEAS